MKRSDIKNPLVAWPNAFDMTRGKLVDLVKMVENSNFSPNQCVIALTRKHYLDLLLISKCKVEDKLLGYPCKIVDGINTVINQIEPTNLQSQSTEQLDDNLELWDKLSKL